MAALTLKSAGLPGNIVFPRQSGTFVLYKSLLFIKTVSANNRVRGVIVIIGAFCRIKE